MEPNQPTDRIMAPPAAPAHKDWKTSDGAAGEAKQRLKQFQSLPTLTMALEKLGREDLPVATQ